MSLKGWIAKQWAARRARQIARITAEPKAQQQALLKQLLKKAAHTAFGKDHGFAGMASYTDYRTAVPIRDYEALKPYVMRAYAGEQNVLWPGQPLYFAKTSGTTSGAKYIPITRDSMPKQVKGARDALLLYIHETGDAAFLDGKMIFLSGSPELTKNEAGINTGRLSGIANHYVPSYLTRNRVPSYATNIIDDWEKKVAAITQETTPEDLRLISGIPPWVHMYLEVVQEKTSKTPAEVWPNLQVFIQGGVDFSPYRALINQAFGRPLTTVEVYPASEGFIAVQDRHFTAEAQKAELLLMLDYGIFYEFMPLEEYGKTGAKRLPLWEVETGVPYALFLTTNAGLWAYDLGDTVTFTSTAPYRLQVSGRVKHFISAFGEHVIEQEVNRAMEAALAQHGGKLAEFSVAPQLGDDESYHEWLVEFEEQPREPAAFAQTLDQALRQQNSYYDDLRKGNMLLPARLTILAKGTCRAYMASIGKLGGQNKFPRLANDRKLAEGLLQQHKALQAS